ncbi:MAG: hypothetical protein M0R77_19735 [Gammaproteobacteria bacterium]|nr:hypothetical protein [Gammaproteobacteria bacterium]
MLRTLTIIIMTLLLSGCGSGDSGTPPPPASSGTPPPPAPSGVTLTPTAIKTFRFAWSDVEGESEYRLLENPDGASGFTQVATLPADSTEYDYEVFLPAWVNARYILQACNNEVCNDFPEVSISGALEQAIGYVKGSNSAHGDNFGHSFALSADGATLAVGAPYEDGSGAVYLY